MLVSDLRAIGKLATSVVRFQPKYAEMRSNLTIISRTPPSTSANISVIFPRALHSGNAIRSYDRQRGINITAPEGEDTNREAVVLASNMRPQQGRNLGGKDQNRQDHPSPSNKPGMLGALMQSVGPTRGGSDNRCIANAGDGSNNSVRNVLARSLGSAVATVRGKSSPTKDKKQFSREDNIGGVVALMYPVRGDTVSARQPQGQEQSRLGSLARTSTVPGTLSTSGTVTPSVRDKVNGSSYTAGTDGSGVRAGSASLRGSEVATPSHGAHGITVRDGSFIPIETNSNHTLAQPPPAPRVATLASSKQRGKEESVNGGYDNRKNSKQQWQQPFLVKTKDFDPDKLECVLRHQASLADRAKEIESSREATRRRSLFRARPLPAFLGSDGGETGARTEKHGGGINGKGCGEVGGEGKLGLLAALEQV